MAEYKAWIQKAEDDLNWTKSSLESNIWYGACFTSQQVVEKSLKGYLLAQDKQLRKIHDVVTLLKDCVELDPGFEEIRLSIESVYPYYVETRYPSYDEIDRFTKEQAEEAYEHAKTVLEFVKQKLL